MTDEVHQLPGVLFILGRSTSPRWHSRETNSVLDDVEQLSVGQLLGCRQPHIGRRRVQMLSKRGIAAAVVGMARETMIRPMCTSFFHYLRVPLNGIHPGLRVGRQRQCSGFLGDPAFHSRGLLTGAESAALTEQGQTRQDGHGAYRKHSQEEPSHGTTILPWAIRPGASQ